MTKKKNQKGFTLIELSVVLVIIGILLSAVAAAYLQYQKYQQVKVTHDNIAAAQEAIQKYQQDNGFYPCPADPAGKDLKATNCAAAATGAVRVVDLGGGKRVRIGAMPILDLSGNTKLVPGSGALDGFRRRLTYAVTESMAVSQAGFNASAGAITIKNAEGTTQTATANFLILSHGEDGIGAYTAMGTAGQPCGTGTVDSENCNGDAVFTVRSPGEAASFAQGSASYNDDFADYGTAEPVAPKIPQAARFKWFSSPHTRGEVLFDTAYGCKINGYAGPYAGPHGSNLPRNPDGTLENPIGIQVMAGGDAPSCIYRNHPAYGGYEPLNWDTYPGRYDISISTTTTSPTPDNGGSTTSYQEILIDAVYGCIMNNGLHQYLPGTIYKMADPAKKCE